MKSLPMQVVVPMVLLHNVVVQVPITEVLIMGDVPETYIQLEGTRISSLLKNFLYTNGATALTPSGTVLFHIESALSVVHSAWIWRHWRLFLARVISLSYKKQ